VSCVLKGWFAGITQNHSCYDLLRKDNNNNNNNNTITLTQADFTDSKPLFSYVKLRRSSAQPRGRQQSHYIDATNTSRVDSLQGRGSLASSLCALYAYLLLATQSHETGKEMLGLHVLTKKYQTPPNVLLVASGGRCLYCRLLGETAAMFSKRRSPAHRPRLGHEETRQMFTQANSREV
jgi:hypothetical protein